MIRIILFALVFLTLCTCKIRKKTIIKESSDIEIINIDNITKENSIANIRLNSLIDSPNYVPLESGPGFYIGDLVDIRNQYLRVSDEYYVFNSIFFKKNGKYARTIGRYGNGPGEYSYIRDICIDNLKKRIFIYNHWKHDILCYDFGGSYLETIKDTLSTFQSSFFYAGNDKLIFYSACLSPTLKINELNIESRKCQNLLKIDFSTTLTYNQKFSFPPFPHWKTYVQDSIMHFMIKFPSHIEESDYIYQYKDNIITPKYKFELGKFKPESPFSLRSDPSSKGYIDVIGESSNYLFIRFFVMQKDSIDAYNIVYCKKEGSLNLLNSLNSTERIANLILSRMTIKDDSLFSYIFPYEINKKSLEYIDRLFFCNEVTENKLISISKKIEENDNPIIIVAKIK